MTNLTLQEQTEINEILIANSINESMLHTDIADTDEIISAIISQKWINSLAYAIADVQPIHGPTGAQFAIKYQMNPAIPEVPAVAQVDTVNAIVAANSTVYTLDINGINFSYTSDATATVAEITAGLVTEINITHTNGSVPVIATDNSTSITLTAVVPGTPFTATSTGIGSMVVGNTVPNTVFIPGVAEDNKTIVKRTNVTVENDTTSDTGFTQEAIMDMQKQFGKRARSFVSRALGGISSKEENTKLLAFLDANAEAKAALTLTDSGNIETNMFQLSQKVAESVVEINSIDYRTLNSFCVVPLKLAATVLGIGNYFTDNVVENGLYMGKVGKTKYYLNPDNTSTTAYVGLSGSTPGNSSIIFSPYQHQIVEAQDPDSGEIKLFNINRYAITLNGLSEVSNPMLHKFNIA